eukprot:84574_1
MSCYGNGVDDPYTIEYPEPDKHHWDFDLQWDEQAELIVFTVKDEVTKGIWEVRLGKKQYKDPSTEYDNILKVFDDKDTHILCKLDDQTGSAQVRFVDSGVTFYKFVCKPR